MSVYMAHNEGSACPRCGDDNITPIVIHDPNFGQKNGLPKSCALDIAEEGDFTLHVCLECGFTMARNDGVASTSQLRALILSHFITTIPDCPNKDLEDYIDDLIAVGGIPKADEKNFMLDRGANDEVRLEVLKAINSYASSCDLDSLVEMYNAIYADDEISEVCEPTDQPDGADFRAENGMRIAAKDVLADD